MIDVSVVIPLGKGRSLDIKESLSRFRGNVEVIVESGPNPSRNRNVGARKAKGKLVAFVNSHTILTESWLDNVKEFFQDHPEVDVVGGPQLTSRDDPWFERASGMALVSVYSTANLGGRYKRLPLRMDADESSLTSANLICKRKVLKKVKFDENLWPGEDPKFIYDVKKAGFMVAYSPDILVYHKRRTNVGGLSKQIYSYGFNRSHGLSRTILRNPLFLVPAVFLLYILLLPTLVLLHGFFIIPLGVYAFSSVFFSIYEGFQQNDLVAASMLPLTFLVIHVSYGAGIWTGLLSR